jgi:hypothetical protein
MNDQGVYGYGQLATILRARYCDPKITSLTKTDGLTFRVREILEGLGGSYGSATNGTLANGASGNGATTSEATHRAGATVSTERDRAMDNDPNKPGTEAIHASAGIKDHSNTRRASAPKTPRSRCQALRRTRSESECRSSSRRRLSILLLQPRG